jgi:hypothetical protein
MQTKKIQKKEYIRKYWIFFTFYILAILVLFVLNMGFSWFLFLVFLIVISLVSFLIFWQIFLLPEFRLTDHLILSKYVIQNHLFKSSLCFTVKNGYIVGDYGLLKIKPQIRLLNIDQNSAVLLENSEKQRVLLFSGIHLLKNKPKIIGTFSLGFRYIHIGPVDQFSLSKQNAHGSLTDYHARISLSDKTKTLLHSGVIIYPSLSIFYMLDIKSLGTNEFYETLSRSMLFNKADSTFVTPRQFDNYLVNEILENWSRFANSTEDEKLLAMFPGKFKMADELMNGLLVSVYVDNIFT